MRNYDKGVVTAEKRGDYKIAPPPPATHFRVLPGVGKESAMFGASEDVIKEDGVTYITWLREKKTVSVDGNPYAFTAAMLGINTTKEPTGHNGYFNNKVLRAKGITTSYEFLDELKKKVEGYGEQLIPSKQLELTHLSKAIDQSGISASAWINPDGSNPLNQRFRMTEQNRRLIDEAFDHLRLRKKAVNKRLISPGSVYTPGSTASYNTGSAFGIHGYVPGSHPNNILSLKYHANVAKTVYDRFKASGKYSYEGLGEPGLDDFDVASIMLILRGGFIGQGKLIPTWDWKVANGNVVMKLNQLSSGVYRRTRIIRPIAACYNINSYDSNQYSATYINNLPAHHLGDYAANAIGVMRLQNSIKRPMVSIRAKDQSAFDQHVNQDHYDNLIRIRAADSDTPGFFEHHYETKRNMKTYTAVKDKAARTVSFLEVYKNQEVDSGDMETWTWDHDVNETAIVTAMAKVMGWSITQAEHQCATFNDFYPGLKTWYFVIKGDDTIIGTSWLLDHKAFDQAMAEFGLVTKNEEGTALLMNYIDFTKKMKYTSPFNIKGVQGMEGFLSYGLICKRMASKIMPEYGTDSHAVACVSLYESLKSCVHSPLFGICRPEINHLCSIVGVKDFPALHLLVNSQKFRLDLQKETAGLSGMDSYIKDKYKRMTGDQGGDPDLMKNSVEYGLIMAAAQEMGLQRAVISEMTAGDPERTAMETLKEIVADRQQRENV